MTRDEKYGQQEKLLKGLLLQTPWLSVPYVVKQVVVLVPEILEYRKMEGTCDTELQLLREVVECFEEYSWCSESVIMAVKQLVESRVIDIIYRRLFDDYITQFVFEQSCDHFLETMMRLWR